MEEIFVTRTSLPSFEEYCETIRPLWDSHVLTNMGPLHERLQSRLEDYLQGPVALTANGHLALEAMLEAFRLPRGGEVITTPFTFVSTTHALVRRGLVPVFCDVLEADGTLDPAGVEALLTERSVAILPVHIYGHPCQVEKLEELARRHGLRLLYDAAHAFGVRYRGVPLVRYGEASILSFHATKVFSTVEGGAVCFSDEALRQALADISNFGIRDTEHCAAAGGNAKLNELQAAMGLCNLRTVEADIAYRRAAYQAYEAGLPASVRLLKPREGTDSNYGYCPVVFVSQAQRDRAFAALETKGIHPRKYFYPLTSHAACHAGKLRGSTPVAASLSARILALPLYSGISEESVSRVCSTIS